MGLRYRTQLLDYHCFFITTTFYKRIRHLEDPRMVAIINESFHFVNEKYACRLIAYVWMPDHIHFICYFEKENKLIEYMRDFKKYTSFRIRRLITADGNDALMKRLTFEHRAQKFKVWDDRFHDVHLFTRKALLIRLNYIHDNPVRAGLVSEAIHYPYSSAAFYFKEAACPFSILHLNEVA